MTREEVKKIVDKVQIYRQSFLITNNLYQEWNRILEPYDYLDVDNKLNSFFKDGDNYGKYPDPYQLVKHLTKLSEKILSQGMYVFCNLCNKKIKLQDYDVHFDRCNSIDYISKNYKKYYGKNIDTKKLLSMDEKTFNDMYWKFNKQLLDKIDDGDVKDSLVKTLKIHEEQENKND